MSVPAEPIGVRPGWELFPHDADIGVRSRGATLAEAFANAARAMTAAIPGIVVKSLSSRGIAEQAPGAYKSVDAVVEVAEGAGLARRVARLKPVICING